MPQSRGGSGLAHAGCCHQPQCLVSCPVVGQGWPMLEVSVHPFECLQQPMCRAVQTNQGEVLTNPHNALMIHWDGRRAPLQLLPGGLLPQLQGAAVLLHQKLYTILRRWGGCSKLRRWGGLGFSQFSSSIFEKCSQSVEFRFTCSGRDCSLQVGFCLRLGFLQSVHPSGYEEVEAEDDPAVWLGSVPYWSPEGITVLLAANGSCSS
mmetsp:Transcript_28609/g.62960  ORF Transcript_28609/g.62960 Transcript_28609/m.62960 type:complete len:206 (-) Transcript_28609:97-714(-)